MDETKSVIHFIGNMADEECKASVAISDEEVKVARKAIRDYRKSKGKHRQKNRRGKAMSFTTQQDIIINSSLFTIDGREVWIAKKDQQSICSHCHKPFSDVHYHSIKSKKEFQQIMRFYNTKQTPEPKVRGV